MLSAIKRWAAGYGLISLVFLLVALFSDAPR
jgi:hypothetical protein